MSFSILGPELCLLDQRINIHYSAENFMEIGMETIINDVSSSFEFLNYLRMC